MTNKIHQLIIAHRSQLLFILKEEANVVINVIDNKLLFIFIKAHWFYVKLNTVFQSIFHTFFYLFMQNLFTCKYM